MDASLVEDALKKIVGAALGAIGSKVGGQLSSLILNFIGFPMGGEDAVAAQLKQIEAELKNIDKDLHGLMNQTAFDQASKGFATYTALLTTDLAQIKAILTDTTITDAERKAEIKKYLLNPGRQLANIDVYLTAIDNAMTGQSNAIIGQDAVPLMTLWMNNYWSSIVGDTVEETYAKIMDAYTSAVLFQMRATSLAVSYHSANDMQSLARQSQEVFVKRIVNQYKILVNAMPDIIGICGIRDANLMINADSCAFQFPLGSGTFVPIQHKNGAMQVSAQPASVEMQRGGKLGAADGYSFNSDFFYTGVREGLTIITYSETTAGRTVSHTEEVQMLTTHMTPPNPTLLKIAPTPIQDIYRLIAADGMVLGVGSYGVAGKLLSFNKKDASDMGQSVKFGAITKVPVAATATVSGWSRAYQSSNGDLGVWAKGFRVRYRVIFLNRFGESPKSDWIKAPNCNQDTEHYFDGRGAFYMPQIQMPDPIFGLVEGYRLFRQFDGAAEEEIEAHLVANPKGSEYPPILDDFNG